MGVGNPFHQTQPETVAVNLAIERGPAAIEGLEDVGQVLRIDAGPAIPDDDPDFGELLWPGGPVHRDAQPAPVGAMFDRVRHEVVDRAAEGSLVFEVWSDNERLYQSGIKSGPDDAEEIEVDVTGRSRIKLRVTNAGDGNAHDRGAWADARVECAE